MLNAVTNEINAGLVEYQLETAEGLTFQDIISHLQDMTGEVWIQIASAVNNNYHIIQLANLSDRLNPPVGRLPRYAAVSVDTREKALSSPAFAAVIAIEMERESEPEDDDWECDGYRPDNEPTDPEEIEEDIGFDEMFRNELNSGRNSNIASLPWQTEAAPIDGLDEEIKLMLGQA